MSAMEAACAMYLRKLTAKPPYASIIPDRRPVVKCHSNIGLAKLAVGYSAWGGVRGGEIYRRTDDGWELVFRVESGTPASELPWREN